MSQQQDHISTELLIDYVDGILGREARKRVENAIRSDEDTAGVVAGIRTFYDKYGKDRDALEKWLEEGKREDITAGEKGKVRKLNVWPKVAIAIAAAAILVFAFVGLQDTRKSLADDYAALPIDIEFETRSNEDLATIKSAFDNQNFAKVLELSEGDFEENIQLDFMIGVSYFKTEDYAMSVAYLTGLEDTRLSEYANWYIALAYAITEQSDRAERAMNGIVGENGKYSDEAAKWLALDAD